MDGRGAGEVQLYLGDIRVDGGLKKKKDGARQTKEED